MILTLIILGVCGGAFAGGVIARSRTRAARATGEGGTKELKVSEELLAEPRTPEKPAKKAHPTLSGSPCQLGDVVLRATGEEAWLAGAIVFEEDALSSVLFCSPDKGGHSAVFVRSDSAAPLLWLHPVDAGALQVGREPPASLEWEGIRFERVRRLPLRARVIGTGAPTVGATAIVAEYRTPSTETLLILIGTERTIAYRGEVVSEGLYEVIASGTRTLEE